MSVPRIAVNTRLRRTRAYSVVAYQPVIVDSNGAWFNAGVYQPRKDGSEGNPRDDGPTQLIWLPTDQNLPDLRAGDRVSDGTVEYEIIGGPVDRRAGFRVLAKEFVALPRDVLAPVLGELQEQGGAAVPSIAEVPFAIWPVGERDVSHGIYHDYAAEVPIEFATACAVPNRQLSVADGGPSFRIGRCITHVGADGSHPHASLELTIIG
jgi:hypothetical protein